MTMSGRSMGTVHAMLKPHYPALALISALQVVYALALVDTINLLRPMLSEAVSGGDFEDILDLGYTLVVLTILLSAIAVTVSYLSSKVATRISEFLRSSIMESTIGSDDLEKANRSTTNAMTTLTNDVNEVQQFIFESIRTYLPLPLIMVLLLWNSYLIEPNIAIIMLLTLLLELALIVVFSKRVSHLHSGRVEAMDRVNNMLREKIAGARTVRAYNAHEFEEARFKEASDRFGQYNRKVAMNSYFIPSLATAFMWMFIVFMLVASSLHGMGADVEKVVLFMQYATYLVATLAVIPYVCITGPKARVCFDNIGRIIESEREPEPVGNGVLAAKEGSEPLVIEGLTVRDRLGRLAVDDVDLTVRSGEVLTMIGPNGCGLAELFSAVMGFNRYEEGTITVGGLDASEANMGFVRDSISVASNTRHIFRGTLRFNIDPHGKHEDREILDICEELGLGPYIESLPDGLDTELCDDSASFSGGQRLLIIMARSLLRNSMIHVFYDCFFSLDSYSKELALGTILERCKGGSIIFLMHDASTCPVSGRIILVDRGRIVDQGSHSELLDRSDLYRDLNVHGQGGDGVWA
jgi:ATP-binding cassette subfamily B protein